LNPLEPIETMTAYIVQVSLGDVPHGTLEFSTIFAVGFMLFLMTLFFNLLAYFLRKRSVL
jgi:phosphate transport system permease protein